MKISAVIPVREGSTRIKDKNIRKFADSSLLEIKINQLKRIKKIDKIIVSSDSKKMLELAEEMGVITHNRPLEYCDEKSKTFNEVVSFIAKDVVKDEIMMWAPCVCPLLLDETIIKGIDKFIHIKEEKILSDSVVTAKLTKEYIFNDNGPVNFSIDNHVPSQKLPNWYTITNGFFIADRKNMLEWGFVYGKNPYLLKVGKIEAIDIDDKTDFYIAEHIYKQIMKERGAYE